MIMTPFEPFKIYWNIYGGFKNLIKSPYLILAILITGGCFPFWLDTGPKGDTRPMADVMLTVVPALMAFTLAGMAIILALSGTKFTAAIRENGRVDSLFMKIVVLFFHFILVQTIALILAFFSSSYPEQAWLAAITFFFAIYGVTSAIAIAAMLLNVSRIYNITADEDDNSKTNNSR